MDFNVKKFNEVKHDAEEAYNKLGKIRCPYFGEDVHFNAKGLDHLIFKKWNKTRLIDDQFSRFRHLHLASKVIENSKTLQGILTRNKFERIKKKDGKWEQVLKMSTYYEFIAVMESHNSMVRVKVVVKQITGAEKHFLSIIPFWGSSKKGERIIHSGNPEND